MAEFPLTKRNEIKRLPQRATYDQSTIYAIIDDALYCHVGFVEGDQPYVIPTMHARMGDNIILHGSKASRIIRHIQAGNEICISITLLDGLVLARSASHHSMNYRSVVIFGHGHAVENDQEKRAALEALMEHMLPGRWQDIRKPDPIELNATGVVSIPIENASAKIRTGPPVDDEQDKDLPIWAGVLPMVHGTSSPQPEPNSGSAVPIPEYILQYKRWIQL
jgi:nitroimidazol reductase NimA-like FMN-containing flavoprotein (pyridoxamine 5'-phosphate oxidase superfamily)